MELDIDLVKKFLVEKINELSYKELEYLKNNPTSLEGFVGDHLAGDIMVNDLKQEIIPEADFFERKAFLIKIETFLIKYSERFNKTMKSF